MGMAGWLYLIHPPRDDFVETITPDEDAARAIMMRDPAVTSA